jgi:hypothetical protein
LSSPFPPANLHLIPKLELLGACYSFGPGPGGKDGGRGTGGGELTRNCGLCAAVGILSLPEQV